MIEALESRVLLSASTGHTIAELNGVVAAANTVTSVAFTISEEDFTARRGAVILGLEVMAADGSPLDPAVGVVRNAAGSIVKTLASQPNTPAGTSLVIAELKFGSYTLEITGDNGTSGGFEVGVQLIGDVDGNRKVDVADQIQTISLVRTRDYLIEADGNRDGALTGLDISLLVRNLKIATDLNPLVLDAAFDPGAIVVVDGVSLTNHAEQSIVGVTAAGTRLEFDLDGDDVVDDIVIAGADGAFQLDVRLIEGNNSLTMIAVDTFGQSRMVTLDLRLDTIAPAVSLSLDAAFDTAPVGDNSTTLASVALAGITEAQAMVALYRSDNLTDSLGTAVADEFGAYAFSDVDLAIGANGFVAVASDAVGNTTEASVIVTRLGDEPLPPLVAVALVRDTGASDDDGLTSDPSVRVDVTDAGVIAAVSVSINGGDAFDLTEGLPANQSFEVTLDATMLASILGMPLNDGVYALEVVAVDEQGNTSQAATLQFVLDATDPGFDEAGLAFESDTGRLGDGTTTQGAVRIVGRTEPGALVQLGAAVVSADVDGNFAFENVALAMGSQVLSLTSTDEAGNASTAVIDITRVSDDGADLVLLWNHAIKQALLADTAHPGPTWASRTVAIVTAAMHDAVMGILRTHKPYLIDLPAPTGASVASAMSAAAHHALSLLLPTQGTTFDDVLATALATVPDGPGKDDGIAYGIDIAQRMVDARRNDGSEDVVLHMPGSEPGQWRPTYPDFSAALTPHWGQVEPFTLTGTNQFQAPAPPALDSAAYAAAFDEVYELGAIDSTTRTADQTEIGLFWAYDRFGMGSPITLYQQAAINIAESRGNTLAENVHLFALLGLSMADAGVAAWQTKYDEEFWRPITAIREADIDGNPATLADTDWLPLGAPAQTPFTPNHPSYVSGHSTFGTALFEAMAAFYGTEDVSFSLTSAELPGVVRDYANFSEAIDENGRSRIYLGVHWSFDDVYGRMMGAQVAQHVTDNHLLPMAGPGASARLVMDTGDSDLDGLTADPTIFGRAYAAASIVGLRAGIDDGNPASFVDITGLLQGDGSFVLNQGDLESLLGTPLADGMRTLYLEAEDQAGLVSPMFALSFTLDTQAPPLITFGLDPASDSEPVGDNQTTAMTVRLIGQTEPGATVLLLETGTTLMAAADGAFAFDDNALALGTNDFNVQLSDAAGNQSLQMLTLTRLAVDAAGPQIDAALQQDTGGDSGDGLTFDLTIVGSVIDTDAIVAFHGSLNGPAGGPYVDLLHRLQPDGSFTLTATDLSALLGQPLDDGAYTLRLVATDQSGNTSDELVTSFTLDATAPTVPMVMLDPAFDSEPVGDGFTTFETVTLIGQTSPNKTVTLLQTGATTQSNNDGQFTFTDIALVEGGNALTVRATDPAGNNTATTISITRGLVEDPIIVLSETDSFVNQAAVPIELGQTEGSRVLSFDIETMFATSDQTALKPDTFLVYLVDADNPSQTLLDRGEPGTALFALTEGQVDMALGVVTFNGTTVRIDLTDLGDRTAGLLVLQLLNSDGDVGGSVRIGNLRNEVDPEGVAAIAFSMAAQTPVLPGAALDLTGMLPVADLQPQVSNVRFDPNLGRYVAELRVRNEGEAIGRKTALLFDALPEGVMLLNASGVFDGKPYFNLTPAIQSGGLDRGATTSPVLLAFDNPDLIAFGLTGQVYSSGANQAPAFDPVPPISLSPGAYLEVPLTASDPDGDAVYFTASVNGPLPTMALDATGRLILTPTPSQIGSYALTINATDGTTATSQVITIDVVPDPITTTRLSGVVQNTDGQPLEGIQVGLGDVMATTDAQGRFQLAFTGDLPGDKVKIAGYFAGSTLIYPSLTEELSLLLDRPVFAGFDNQLDRPIYLPMIDLSEGTQIMPAQATTVTSNALPGLAIEVAADTLTTPEGNPFTGVIAIGIVPPDRTPANLPEGLFPSTVITIQPGGMVFTTPAPITFPNTDGYAPGQIVDLWSANPNTGQFELVGKMQASPDGQLLHTIEGGLVNTSWHFPAPPLPETSLPPSDAELENQDEMCNSCEATEDATSMVELHSGAILETHRLVSYQSLGQTRGITLHYDSQRADPRPIVHFGVNNPGSVWPYAYARLAVTDGVLRQTVAGYDPSIHAPVDPISRNPPFGLDLFGAHFWNIQGPGVNNVKLALQADMRNLPSGVYEYQLERGLTNMSFTNQQPLPGASGAFALRMVTNDTGSIVLVNAIESPFGAGWQVGGIQQLVESPDGSVLLIDGDGTNVVFSTIDDQPGQYRSPVGDFSTLVQNPDNSFTRTTTDKSVYQYDEAGHLTSMTDRNGNTTTHVYEAGRLVRIVDPVGLETSFTYNGERVSSITDPAGRVTLLEHDAAGNLIRVTDPDGASRAFEYDTGHHIIAEVDQAGEREQTIYGYHGRAIGSIRKDGTTLTFDPLQTRVLLPTNLTTDPVSPPSASIAAAQAIARTADANGNTTTTVLDKAGQVIRTIDSVGGLPSVVRNSDNLVASMTDARGYVTQYRYDDRGNRISVADDVSRGVTVGGMSFPGEKFAAGARPYSVTMGDFNGDGIPDMAVANINSNDVSVLLGNVDGTFASQQRFPVGDAPASVTAGDFNDDGLLDLATANVFSNDVSVLLGNGDGTFQPQQRFSVGIRPYSVVTGDFNGDGVDDLATANRSYNDVSVLLGNGDGTFQPQQRFAAGSRPFSVTTGDFNGDGVADLATANSSSNDVSVLLGNGDGTFQPQQRFAAGSQPRSVTTGDFNGDGVDDLTAANSSSNDVSVLLGNGDGTFQSQQRFAVGSQPRSVTTGDFNGDGVNDLATANVFSNDVSVLLGNGDGTFSSQQVFLAGINPFFVTAGDFDGDGVHDLAVANSRSNDVSVLPGNGDGTFRARVPQSFGTGSSPYSVTTGDFDGDGLIDLVVANGNSNDVSVLLGDGGAFQVQQLFAVGSGPQSVTVGDFNSDGVSDLAVANFSSNDVSVLLGNGDGTFQPQLSFGVGFQPHTVTTGDFNGDGLADLAVGNEASNDVSVLLGNGDGTFQPEQRFAAGSRPYSVTTGDFNGDGVADLAVANSTSNDISVLLGNGDGTFQAQRRFAVGSFPASITTGDFNGDGADDLAVGNLFSDDVSVLLGNGDGTFQPQQRLAVSQNPYSLTTGDINGDGMADLVTAGNFGDVTVLLGNGDGTFRSERRFAATNGEGNRSVTLGDFNLDGRTDIVVANSLFDEVTMLLNLGGIADTPVSPLLFTYDDNFSQLTSVTDELGHATLFEIDPLNGNLLAVIQVIGERDSVENGETDDLLTTYAYTPQGLLDLIVDPLGRVTDIDYDSRGLITTITKAVGTAAQAMQSFEYDAAGNTIAVIDENGNRSQFDFDAMNRLTRMTQADPDGGGPLTAPITEVAYDARGRVVELTDAVGSRLERIYDSLDRLILMRDNDGNETAFNYDLDGNLIEAIDPNGNTTRFTYDARDRRTSIIDPDAGVTTFRYDSSGNLLFLTDPNGNRTSFAYDARSRLVREVDPLGAESLFSYDVVNNLAEVTDRNGRVITFGYDDLHRRTSENWLNPGNSQPINSIHYSYDKAGNLLQAGDTASNLTFTYDARNRMLTADNQGTADIPAVVLSYSYDAIGNVLSMSESIGGVSGATTDYQYDALHRMIQVTQTATMPGVATDKRVNLSYNAIGQFETISRYSDLAGTQLVIRTDYAYDSLDQLIGIDHDDANGTAVAFYEFVYDSAGRLLTQADIDGHTAFFYDSRDQLTAAERETADSRGDEDYAYDANGNRVESHLHGSAYVTGLGNQLLSDGVYTYDYDAEGNMIRRTEIATGAYRTFEWDHRNRLTRVADVTAGGTEVQDVSYGYDVLGRRIAVTTDADGSGPEAPLAEYYVYDGAHIALEFVDADATGMVEQPTLIRRNLFGPGVDHILSQEDVHSAQTRWMLPDHLGSVRDIVDDNGSVLNHVLYDSFGNLVAQTDPGEASRYGFAGREFDSATGLQYLRARHYDPAIGRFISRDPYGNIDGPNHYAFVGNQPTTQVDRSGLNGQDVNHDVNLILSVFRLVVETLTQTGMRLEDSPAFNNFLSSLQRLDPEVRNNFVLPTRLDRIRHMGESHRLLGCGEQAGLLVNELEAINSLLDSVWSFNVANGFTPLPHQWTVLEAINNPDSPVIIADPWSGRIEIRWPTHTEVEQFNGTDWDQRFDDH